MRAIKEFTQEVIQKILKKLGTTDISGIGDGTITGAISTLNSDLEINVKSKEYSITTNANGIASILCDGYCIGFTNAQGYAMTMTRNISNGVTFIFKNSSGSIGSNMTFNGVIYYI